MRLKQEFYRLPFRFDAERLATEALSFPESAWRAHPSGYDGNTALILVSAHGGQMTCDKDVIRAVLPLGKKIS